MKRHAMVAVVACCCLVAATGRAVPGDEFWADDFYRVGLAGEVHALAEYDGRLVIGGTLTAAGGVLVHALAVWNGVQWSEFAGGVNGEVTSLLVSGSSLIVAGEFTSAGGVAARNIARWDGAAWHALGDGGGRVENLAEYGGQPVALGDFSDSAGPAATKLAAWNGTAWVALGGGPQSPGLGVLNAATILDNNLVVGGGTAFAVWNGSSWSAPYPFPGNWLHDGVWPGVIRVLKEYRGELVAGGSFWYYDETGENFTGVARWDGARWVGLQHGLQGFTPFGTEAHSVCCLFEFNGDLIVGGSFSQFATPYDCASIVRWDGTAWHPMDLGVSFAWGIPEGGGILAIGTWRGEPFVGGVFRLAGSEGSVECNNISRWDGAAWQPVGPRGLGLDLRQFDYALAQYHGEIVAGGQHLTPTGWLPLGEPPNGFVRALMVRDDQLVAGGSFTQAGGQLALNVAVWDGAAWNPLGGGVPAAVYALTVFDGDLFAGGYRWSGTDWINELQTNGPVYALLVWNGDLYAAGAFDTARGVPAAGIVRWDGAQCHALGAGLTHVTLGSPMSGFALVEYQGELVVGGSFYRAGNTLATHLARWNGADWSAFSVQLNSAASQYGVYSLSSLGSQLFAGGRFVQPDANLSYIGRFDGVAWHALGSGVSGGLDVTNVRALLIANQSLWVGGVFETAGGRPAFNICRWRDLDIFTPPSAIGGGFVPAISFTVAPNPFNPRTTIRFDVPAAGMVRLAIYDVAGRRVRVLVEGEMPGGSHEAVWDGRDVVGRAMASGSYFARLEAGGNVQTDRLSLVR